jgi:hypothetical protein
MVLAIVSVPSSWQSQLSNPSNNRLRRLKLTLLPGPNQSSIQQSWSSISIHIKRHNLNMDPVSFNETGAVWGNSPCTPPPRHGQNLRTPTSTSKNGSPSHGLSKRLSFSALKSPLKSLGLRSKPRASDEPASPKIVRRSKSVFNLLPSIRSIGFYQGDPTKDPVTAERPKTTSPNKGNTRASKDKPLNYLELSDPKHFRSRQPYSTKKEKKFWRPPRYHFQ